MAQWGAHIAGICEPSSPGGYTATGIYLARDGTPFWSEGFFIGHKPRLSEIRAEFIGIFKVMNALNRIGDPDDKATVCFTHPYIDDLLRGVKRPLEDSKDRESQFVKAYLRRILNLRKSPDAPGYTIKKVSREWVETARFEAQMAIWRARKVWPERDVLHHSLPDYAISKLPKPKTLKLDDFTTEA